MPVTTVLRAPSWAARSATAKLESTSASARNRRGRKLASPGDPMFNPWLGFTYNAARLLFEAQWVVAARMARIAAGGALAQTEVQRMLSEKAAALVEANMIAATAVAGGRKAPATANRVLRVYRTRVRRNRRRLLRSRRR